MSVAFSRAALMRLLVAGLACWLAAWASAAEAPEAPEPAPSQADAVVAPPAGSKVVTQDGEVIAADQIEEPDLADLPLSNAARVRLDRARHSVVQIRGYLGEAGSSAFHGSGFAVGDEGFIVTNYHVVADAVLHPRRYRLEYVTWDERRGPLQVYAVDVRNDLAVVKAVGLELPPLRLRTDIPRQGARAYSIGYPLNLGLTITEGVANGLASGGSDQRIHYTGAINSGMSGGPALDAAGGVYGVNVSVIAARQLVGFVVPARHILPLLRRAQAPLDESLSSRQVRDAIAQQALAREAEVLEPGPRPGSQTVFGYTLPTFMGRSFECSANGATESWRHLQLETINCSARGGVLLQMDLEVGNVRFEHRIAQAQDLHPLQFAQRVNGIVAEYRRSGSARHVADFACKQALVSLDGFDARVSTCARQYRLFAGLYDIAVTVTSINSSERAVVSQLDLTGVGFEPGMQFVRRYLGAMRWTP